MKEISGGQLSMIIVQLMMNHVYVESKYVNPICRMKCKCTNAMYVLIYTYVYIEILSRRQSGCAMKEISRSTFDDDNIRTGNDESCLRRMY